VTGRTVAILSGRVPIALQHRYYRRLWGAIVASNVGTWTQATMVPFVLFRLTGRAAWLGVAAVATAVPAGLLTPLAGHVADRFSRRNILVAAQCVQAATSLSLGAAWAFGVRVPWVLVALVAVDGLAAGLQFSAWSAFTADLLPADALQSAQAVNALQYNLARVVGAAVAGLLLHAFTPTAGFVLNAISFVPLALVLTAAPAPEGRAGSTTGLVAGFAAAVAHVRRTPHLAGAIWRLYVMAAVGLQPVVLAAVHARSRLGPDPRAYSLLIAAFAFGSCCTAILLSTRRTTTTPIRPASLACAAAVVIAALPTRPAVTVIAYAAAGAAYMAAAGPLSATIQGLAPPDLRGRIAALAMAAFTVGHPLVSLAASAGADVAGSGPILAAAGAILGVSAIGHHLSGASPHP
jgi:MFS family permease